METYIKETIDDLELMYCTIKKYDNNSEFLFEIELADNMEIDRLIESLTAYKLSVSILSNVIKIPRKHFTTQENFQQLVNCFRLCVSF